MQARWPSSLSRSSSHHLRLCKRVPRGYDRALAGSAVLFGIRRRSAEVLVEEELPVMILVPAWFEALRARRYSIKHMIARKVRYLPTGKRSAGPF